MLSDHTYVNGPMAEFYGDPGSGPTTPMTGSARS